MMENGPKKDESKDQPQDGPTFDEVVRKMLNTPPKPKKAGRAGRLQKGKARGDSDD